MSYNVTIEQVQNNVVVTTPAANAVSINTTSYPITVSYNATVIGGIADNGLPTGGTAGQVLAKTNSTDYNTQWVNKQDPTLVNDSEPSIQSTGQHWYRPVTGAFYTARNGAWDPINDDGFF